MNSVPGDTFCTFVIYPAAANILPLLAGRADIIDREMSAILPLLALRADISEREMSACGPGRRRHRPGRRWTLAITQGDLEGQGASLRLSTAHLVNNHRDTATQSTLLVVSTNHLASSGTTSHEPSGISPFQTGKMVVCRSPAYASVALIAAISFLTTSVEASASRYVSGRSSNGAVPRDIADSSAAMTRRSAIDPLAVSERRDEQQSASVTLRTHACVPSLQPELSSTTETT
jgi:hypothetical protein